MSQNIIITGTNSGIGKATAQYFAQKGWNVAATMRNTDKAGDLKDMPNISVYQLDVNSDDSVKQAIKKIHEDFGTIDALVNNAGYGENAVFESLSVQDCKNQFETNFFGALRTVSEILPIMRSQKNGSIVNISSYTAIIGIPLGTVYGASKCALEGFTNSLRLEIEQFGIKASIVMPGYTKTNLASEEKMAKIFENIPDGYQEFIAKIVKKASDLPGLSEPIVVAETVFKAVTAETPKPRYTAAPDSEMMVKLQREKSEEELEQFVRNMLIG